MCVCVVVLFVAHAASDSRMYSCEAHRYQLAIIDAVAAANGTVLGAEHLTLIPLDQETTTYAEVLQPDCALVPCMLASCFVRPRSRPRRLSLTRGCPPTCCRSVRHWARLQGCVQGVREG